MGRIERVYDIDSTSVDGEFFNELFGVLNEINPSTVPTRTQIVVHSEREATTYENLQELLKSQNLPRSITATSIKQQPRNTGDKGKVVQLFLNMDKEEPSKSYYTLVGHDDGKLATAKKRIDNLFDQYKTWYYFIFKWETIKKSLELGAALSAGVIAYRISEWSSFSSDTAFLIAVIVFFIVGYRIEKISEKLLPFIDFQLRKVLRTKLWRGFFITIMAGLLINFIWFVLAWILKGKI